jgi:hypothetical protein
VALLNKVSYPSSSVALLNKVSYPSSSVALPPPPPSLSDFHFHELSRRIFGSTQAEENFYLPSSIELHGPEQQLKAMRLDNSCDSLCSTHLNTSL